MFRLFNKLFLLTFFALPVLAVHNGVITDIRRVSDAAVDKVEKTLINNTQRAQKIQNAVPYVLGTAGLGLAGYLAYRYLNRPAGLNLSPEDQKKVVDERNELLKKYYEEKEKTAAYAKQSQDELWAGMKDMSGKADGSKKAGEAKTQGWGEWTKQGMVNFGNGAVSLLKQWPSYFIGGYFLTLLSRKATKITDKVETYAPSVIDRSIDLFSASPDSDWFIKSRTKYHESLKELKRFIKMYFDKFSIDDQITILETNIEEAKKLSSDMALDTSEESQKIRFVMQEMYSKSEVLKAEKKVLDLYSERDLCQRISLNSSHFIMQIEKVLGFMSYSNKVTLVSKIDRNKKKEIVDKNQLIRDSLKTLTNEFAQAIEKEVKVGRNDNTGQFARDFGSFIKKIKQEIVSFYEVESALESALSEASS